MIVTALKFRETYKRRPSQNQTTQSHGNNKLAQLRKVLVSDEYVIGSANK